MGKGEGDCQLHRLVIVISSLALQFTETKYYYTAKQMMKAFIDSCRARGQGYFPSEGEAVVFSPALDLELQLNGHTAIEDSPLPTTTSIKSNNMLPTSLSTIPCRHTGCNKKFSTTSNRNKLKAAYHARAVTEAARASKRQKKEPIFYIPHDELR